jgi:hypothetical protein
MRKINKGTEPPSLSAWKRANPQGRRNANLKLTSKQGLC